MYTWALFSKPWHQALTVLNTVYQDIKARLVYINWYLKSAFKFQWICAPKPVSLARKTPCRKRSAAWRGWQAKLRGKQTFPGGCAHALELPGSFVGKDRLILAENGPVVHQVRQVTVHVNPHNCLPSPQAGVWRWGHTPTQPKGKGGTPSKGVSKGLSQ